jgi:hypothetical protein
MNMKIFRVRRALLMALYEYSGAQDLQTLLCSPKVLLESPSAELATDAWTSLVEAGLILPVAGYDQVGRLAPAYRGEIDNLSGALPYRAVTHGPR